jgi:flagellar basal-body rod protein FlgF
MENAQLINLSRQAALQRQMDVVANNLANINTTGFKADTILFDDYQMPVARDRGFSFADQPLEFTQDWATIPDLAPGPLVQTGNPLDVALDGDGFFVVQTPQGERWTRAGAFQIDATGTLVDLSGNPVMGEQGAIRLDPEDTDVTISANGTIMTSQGGKGKLRLVEFADAMSLKRAGDNLFTGGEPTPALTTRVVQGAIERSNVSGVAEMTEMIRVTRAYETLASIMQQQDDIRRSAVSRLGDLNA